MPISPLPGSEPAWPKVLANYRQPHRGRSLLELIVTLVPFVCLWTLAAMSVHHGFWWGTALTIPAAGFLLRLFMIQHDCGHGSFFAHRKADDWTGRLIGVLTLTPFGQWRRDHALHHASSGDLGRRGHGDVPTLTVREYQAKTARQRFLYRVIRHPALLLLGGPIHLMLGQRFRARSTATGTKQINSVWATNAGIVLFVSVALWLLGWKTVLIVYGLPYYLAAMAGVWLFYVQHQFEDAYWTSHGDWDYATAALRGSSHLALPAPLRWFTGNIGLHHVHHLAPRIPNHRLQRCHDENPLMQTAPVVTLRSGMTALRLALWDEDRERLIRFDQIDAT